MAFLTLILLVALINLGVCDECPDNWIDSEFGCYLHVRDMASWHAAKSTCQMFEATLVEIKSKEKNEFVTAIARNRSDTCTWLGGNDYGHEKNWKWMGSQDDFKSFSNWGKNEPNSQNGVEHCLNIYSLHNYTWNDESCNEPCSFICELVNERESHGD